MRVVPLVLPGIDERASRLAVPGAGKMVEALDRAQEAVVIDPFDVPAGVDHGPDHVGGDPLGGRVFGLVDGDDQQAIVTTGPAAASAEVLA
jgi:hypothetical protein